MVQISLVLVSTVTVGSGGASSISFTGIPQTGTDLLLVLSGRSDHAGDRRVIYATFNSDTSSTYLARNLRGADTTTSSGTNSTSLGLAMGLLPGATATANNFGNVQFYVSNYTSSVAKTASIDSSSLNTSTTDVTEISANSYPGTSGITSITLTPLTVNFVQHSTASLYIITKA